jgi:NADPH-dependent ferric siderophore reductase
MSFSDDKISLRTPRRIHHQLRSRMLAVEQIERLTPHLLRITFGSTELEGFSSPGFDDHVKLCFPDPQSGEIILPGDGSNKKPIMREYTPRFFDAEKKLLVIDFVIHDAGIATQWASNANIGDRLGVAGPKGSFIIPVEFDWHLLIGDDTALPAIARRLEELPENAQVMVIAEVDNSDDQIAFRQTAYTTIHWVYRNGKEPGSADLLINKINSAVFPDGDYYAWVACEYSAVKEIRDLLVNERNANPQWIRAASYWKK